MKTRVAKRGLAKMQRSGKPVNVNLPTNNVLQYFTKGKNFEKLANGAKLETLVFLLIVAVQEFAMPALARKSTSRYTAIRYGIIFLP
jgi:hypothetical protein